MLDWNEFTVALSSSNFWHFTSDAGLQIFETLSKRCPSWHCISKPLNSWQTKYFEQSSGWATKPFLVFEQNFVWSQWGALHNFWMGTIIKEWNMNVQNIIKSSSFILESLLRLEFLIVHTIQSPILVNDESKLNSLNPS